MLNKKKNNKGFTLVELLVVIAIIGILAVVAVPSLFKQVDKAKASQVIANVKAIETEIMTEYANGDSDTDAITSVTAYIASDITDIKLGEAYSVVDKGTATDGEINIVVTMPEGKEEVAQNIGDQLNVTPVKDDATKKTAITYTIGK